MSHYKRRDLEKHGWVYLEEMTSDGSYWEIMRLARKHDVALQDATAWRIGPKRWALFKKANAQPFKEEKILP